MRKHARIARFSTDERAAKRLSDESQTDWARVGAMTEAEITAGIAADADESGMRFDWSSASIAMPQPKAVLNMRIDRDVLDFFRSEGRGYQTKINAVLRSYVEQMQQGGQR